MPQGPKKRVFITKGSARYRRVVYEKRSFAGDSLGDFVPLRHPRTGITRACGDGT